MRRFRLAAAVILSASALAVVGFTPAQAADPLGTWFTEGGRAQVRIVNCGGALCGKIVWLKEPIDPETHQPKLDRYNPDTSKRNRPLLGVPIVLDMKPAGANKWEGHVYKADEDSPGIYTGSFTMTGTNTAELKGCVMGGLICKSQTWKRAD
jgi:uncharacterized protein (DUF2147 family)